MPNTVPEWARRVCSGPLSQSLYPRSWSPLQFWMACRLPFFRRPHDTCSTRLPLLEFCLKRSAMVSARPSRCLKSKLLFQHWRLVDLIICWKRTFTHILHCQWLERNILFYFKHLLVRTAQLDLRKHTGSMQSSHGRGEQSRIVPCQPLCLLRECRRAGRNRSQEESDKSWVKSPIHNASKSG